MAEFRSIHTKIWDDEWFAEQEPDGKLFFIYLITNRRASVAGIYRLPNRIATVESGIPLGRMAELYKEFEDAGKVFKEGDIVWVRKLREYQQTTSPKVMKRIETDVADIPHSKLKIRYLQHYDRVSIPYPELDADTDTDTDTCTETDNIPAPFDFSTTSDVEQAYLKRMAKMPPPGMRRAFKELEQEFDPEYIIATINFYADRQDFKKITPAYIKGTLNGRRADGTLDELLPPKPKAPSGLPPGTVVARLEAEMKARERARNGS